MRNNYARFLQNFQSWATIISLIAVPIILAFIGNSFNNNIKQKEIESKYVEISITILNQEPSKSNQATRQWALDVINKYSGVPMGRGAQQELKVNTIFGTNVCKGEDNCSSCKNCKYCKYCAQNGGTCGVCKKK